MPAQGPKGQHFVQRAYLDGFKDPQLDEEGRPALWVYMRGKAPVPQRPEMVARRRYYYCFENEGERDFRVEETLQKLEDASLPVLRRLRERKFALSREEKLTFAGYVALSHVRVPAFELGIDRLSELMAARTISGILASPDELAWAAEQIEKETAEPTTPESLRQSLTCGSVVVKQASRRWSLEQMFRALFVMQSALMGMHWTFLVAPADCPGFLTSDNPVSRFEFPTPGAGYGLEFLFPVCREVCLRASRPSPPPAPRLNASRVRSLCKAMMSQAQDQLYAPYKSDAVSAIFEATAPFVGGKAKIVLDHGKVTAM